MTSVRRRPAVLDPGLAEQGLAAAVAALCHPGLAAIVDLVAWPELARRADGALVPDGPGYDDGTAPRQVVAVHVADHAGHARLTVDHPRGELVAGRHPIPSTDPLAFAAAVEQRADPSPDHERNSYPLPWERLSSLFRDPRSPDVAIVHTPRHFFPERGGHRGEHGSLDAVQSRAPLLLSGPGVRVSGVVADHARVVDIAPTMAWVLGVPDQELAGLDGRIRADLVDRGAARVLGILWDGAHPATVLEMAAAGDLPGVSRLLSRGAALAGGAISEFPSLTLVNHTSALTGLGPGRHGVVGNAYWDRATGERVVPNDPATWHRTAEMYREGVRTVFELVRDSVPGSRTASVNEMTERGSDASTMALIRAGLGGGSGGPGAGFRDTVAAMLPDPRTSDLVTQAHVDGIDDYAFYSAVDLLGLAQVTGLLSSPDGPPRLTWWSSYTTDAAHHGAGPFSGPARDALRDSDARLCVVLDLLQDKGILEDTLILLTADHGFEGSREDCRGDWGPSLSAALEPLGIAWVDEGPGFLYLGIGP